MKKTWKILIGAFLSVMLMTSAHAGSFGMGVQATVASVSAEGTETEAEYGSETENSVMDATAGNEFMCGALYAEYGFGEGEHIVFGIEHIPYSADINNKTLSRTDASNSTMGYTAQDSGTLSANAEISDHTTYYVEVGAGTTGLYGKYGFTEVDINVKQSNPSGYGTYPDKTLDANTYAIGYRAAVGDKGVVKVEGFITDYDTYSATSTTSQTLKANLDVVGAKLVLGFKF